jgi:hypothetical protein
MRIKRSGQRFALQNSDLFAFKFALEPLMRFEIRPNRNEKFALPNFTLLRVILAQVLQVSAHFDLPAAAALNGVGLQAVVAPVLLHHPMEVLRPPSSARVAAIRAFRGGKRRNICPVDQNRRQ